MQGYLQLTERKVVDDPRLCETVGLQVMPLLITKVTLVKIDMKNDNLCICFIILTCMLLFRVGYLKVVQ